MILYQNLHGLNAWNIALSETNNAGYELSINLYYTIIIQKQKAAMTYRITDQ